jgi:hypothetical protein
MITRSHPGATRVVDQCAALQERGALVAGRVGDE